MFCNYKILQSTKLSQTSVNRSHIYPILLISLFAIGGWSCTKEFKIRTDHVLLDSNLGSGKRQLKSHSFARKVLTNMLDLSLQAAFAVNT
jgi:hypothetical protein